MGATFLSGCMVGPNYERPPTPDYGEYREGAPHADSARAELPSADAVADLAWWELYRDSVLQGLITTALAHNKDLQVALARIEEARAAVGLSRADLYPFVDAAAGGTMEWNTEDDDLTVSGVVAGTVFWEADLFGRIRRSNEAALNEYLATEQAYRSVTIALVAQVAELYLVLCDLDNRLAIAEATAEARRGSAEIIGVRFEAGAVSVVAVSWIRCSLRHCRSGCRPSCSSVARTCSWPSDSWQRKQRGSALRRPRSIRRSPCQPIWARASRASRPAS
jgi:multidrug efflux system outer membrane protein